MSERYVATFDSSAPMLGVVVDDEGGRYCTFPTLEKAQGAAARWNQPPLIEFDPPMVWRSIETGERIDTMSGNPEWCVDCSACYDREAHRVNAPCGRVHDCEECAADHTIRHEEESDA